MCLCADVLFICCVIITTIIIRTSTRAPARSAATLQVCRRCFTSSPRTHVRTHPSSVRSSRPPCRQTGPQSDPDLQQILRSSVWQGGRNRREDRVEETRRRVSNGDDSGDASRRRSRDINKFWAKPAHKSLTLAPRRSGGLINLRLSPGAISQRARAGRDPGESQQASDGSTWSVLTAATPAFFRNVQASL